MKNCVCVVANTNDSLNAALTRKKKSNLELCQKCYWTASLMRIINQYDPDDQDFRNQWWKMISKLPETTPMFILEPNELFEKWTELEEG